MHRIDLELPDEMMAAIRQRAGREELDESTTIRQLLALGLRDDACELYRDGRVGLREAASLAGLTLREMLDVLRERGIRGNVTLDQQRRAIRHALDAADQDG